MAEDALQVVRELVHVEMGLPFKLDEMAERALPHMWAVLVLAPNVLVQQHHLGGIHPADGRAVPGVGQAGGG